jgi:hypothetical protein
VHRSFLRVVAVDRRCSRTDLKLTSTPPGQRRARPLKANNASCFSSVLEKFECQRPSAMQCIFSATHFPQLRGGTPSAISRQLHEPLAAAGTLLHLSGHSWHFGGIARLKRRSESFLVDVRLLRS